MAAMEIDGLFDDGKPKAGAFMGRAALLERLKEIRNGLCGDTGAIGGRLRLLRNGVDLENYVAEVPPDNGTMLVFKRADNSWHGHYPYEGHRRALQMNWMTSAGSEGFHAIRHKLSAAVKMLTTRLAEGWPGVAVDADEEHHKCS